MTERHRSIPGITWYEQDLRDMGAVVADTSVDVAFDKSTLDAMIYGNPWNAPADVKENTGKYLAEVRQLVRGWVQVSGLIENVRSIGCSRTTACFSACRFGSRIL